MAQSTEYPDLQWIPARAYGTGRDGKAVRYIVIHYTAGAERNTSAEDGAAYDQRRTDGTSTHYFVDSDSVVQCVLTKNRGNAARHKGNRLGIQYELCGTVQTRSQWLDAASRPTLLNAARQVARDCRKYDIPVRRLSAVETRAAWDNFPNGPRGIVGHVDCTNAYPEDGGDHTDPGAMFPWDVFLDMVRAEMQPTPKPVAPADTEEFVVADKDDVKQAFLEVLQEAHPLPGAIGRRLHLAKPEGPGWGNMSDRELVARLFEMSLTNTRTLVTLAASFAAFVEAEELDDGKVREALDAQEKALTELRAVVDAAVEGDSAGAQA